MVDTEKMYDNMMNKYKYGNLSQKGLYIDETVMRMCYTHRRWFALLIKSLVEEGKNDKALKALQKCEKEIPEYNDLMRRSAVRWRWPKPISTLAR